MNVLKLAVTLLLSIMVSIPAPALAFFGENSSASYATLAEMADAMALEMKADYPGRKLYIDREDIRNDQDGSTSPFSGLMTNELERALSLNGFRFEGQNIDRADYGLSVSYRLAADRVTVYLKLKDLKSGSAYRNLKGKYSITLSKLPPDIFKDSLDDRISRLALKVIRGWQRASELTVFVTPVIEARKKYSSPFSEYVTRKIKTILPNEHTIRVVEEKPATYKLATTRSIAAGKATMETGDAAVVGADAVLEGNYLRGSESISLAITLKNLKGAVLASAEEPIPLSLIQYSADNDTAETLAQIADTEHESGGETVRISTTKGGAYQVFNDGEIVTFRLLVNRPLYLYVYDINPKGEVNLLYPKAGEPEAPKLSGIIHRLPEDSDNWVIKVEPPFGTDAVKVFASNQKLPLPKISDSIATRSFTGNTRSLKRVDVIQQQLASQPAINGRDLVDYYKGVARRNGASLFESTVYIETRGK